MRPIAAGAVPLTRGPLTLLAAAAGGRVTLGVLGGGPGSGSGPAPSPSP